MDVPVRSRVQQRAKHGSLQLTANCIAAIRFLRYHGKTSLRITNRRGHKFAPSITLLSFKTRIKWPPVLTTTAGFPSVFFLLLQYSRQLPSFSARRLLSCFYLTNRFHVALRLFSNRSQMTSNCGKNKKSGTRCNRRVCHSVI